MSHNGIYFEPTSQSKLGNACNSALLSSQPCLSKPPLIQNSFHSKQTRAHSILLISLPEHSYSHLANIPKRQAGYYAFQGSFAREGVISKCWSGNRTKQVDCPNAGTQPPTIGEMAKEEQVQWSSSSKSQVPSDSAKPKRCYKRSHER